MCKTTEFSARATGWRYSLTVLLKHHNNKDVVKFLKRVVKTLGIFFFLSIWKMQISVSHLCSSVIILGLIFFFTEKSFRQQLIVATTSENPDVLEMIFGHLDPTSVVMDNPDVLEQIFCYLDPASVKTASLVSRLISHL